MGPVVWHKTANAPLPQRAPGMYSRRCRIVWTSETVAHRRSSSARSGNRTTVAHYSRDCRRQHRGHDHGGAGPSRRGQDRDLERAPQARGWHNAQRQAGGDREDPRPHAGPSPSTLIKAINHQVPVRFERLPKEVQQPDWWRKTKGALATVASAASSLSKRGALPDLIYSGLGLGDSALFGECLDVYSSTLWPEQSVVVLLVDEAQTIPESRHVTANLQALHLAEHDSCAVLFCFGLANTVGVLQERGLSRLGGVGSSSGAILELGLLSGDETRRMADALMASVALTADDPGWRAYAIGSGRFTEETWENWRIQIRNVIERSSNCFPSMSFPRRARSSRPSLPTETTSITTTTSSLKWR